jgi:flavin reductase (DIM6/NTAB) family NADH-FMN oxidoreductase RutF
MTVSSVVSLSVEPVPQIMFNITKPSITYRAIKSSKRFNIHVLRDTPMAVEIAKHFSTWQVRSRHIGPLALDRAAEFGIAIEPSEDDIVRQWNFYSEKTRVDKKWKPFTPLSKDSVPRMVSPDILYVLQCSVRFDSVNDPSGKAGPIPGGLINLDGKSAIVIGVVENVIHAPDIGYEDTALLYGNRTFMHARGGAKTSTPEASEPGLEPEPEPKNKEDEGILARLAEEAKNIKASS